MHKLMPATPRQVKHVETLRELIWLFYRQLKNYQRSPGRRAARGLQVRFDRIFSIRTGYHDLDQLLLRLKRRKAELLRVLERPETPLNTNASEGDLRGFVIKRKISGGTVSRNDRQARDSMLGLMKTCQKLGLSFWHYLGDRLGMGMPERPFLPWPRWSLPEPEAINGDQVLGTQRSYPTHSHLIWLRLAAPCPSWHHPAYRAHGYR